MVIIYTVKTKMHFVSCYSWPCSFNHKVAAVSQSHLSKLGPRPPTS